MIILFPSFPFDSGRIDPSFAEEERAAQAAGFATAHVDTELGAATAIQSSFQVMYESETLAERLLVKPANPHFAFHGLPEGPAQYLYRGWLLKPVMYDWLEQALKQRGGILVTNLDNYLASHDFPNWYARLEGFTPRSIVRRKSPTLSWNLHDIAEDVAREFGNGSVLLKDYLKSRKHEWHDACFIRPADDREEVMRVTRNFITRQGDDLVGGLVFREFVEFTRAGIHPKSGMPLIQEWRCFVWHGRLLYMAPYWSNGATYRTDEFDWAQNWIQDMALRVQSPFVVLDVAPREADVPLVVEVNDGGTAGIPEGGSAEEFYRALRFHSSPV